MTESVGQARTRTWDKEAERRRKADYRERARLADEDAGMPWEGLTGDEREHAIRQHFGYAPSETRTRAERQAAADRIVSTPSDAEEQARAIWQRQADSGLYDLRPKAGKAIPKTGR